MNSTKDDRQKVVNPSTGNLVYKDGKTYKKAMKENKSKSSSSKSSSSKSSSSKSSSSKSSSSKSESISSLEKQNYSDVTNMRSDKYMTKIKETSESILQEIVLHCTDISNSTEKEIKRKVNKTLKPLFIMNELRPFDMNLEKLEKNDYIYVTDVIFEYTYSQIEKIKEAFENKIGNPSWYPLHYCLLKLEKLFEKNKIKSAEIFKFFARIFENTVDYISTNNRCKRKLIYTLENPKYKGADFFEYLEKTLIKHLKKADLNDLINMKNIFFANLEVIFNEYEHNDEKMFPYTSDIFDTLLKKGFPLGQFSAYELGILIDEYHEVIPVSNFQEYLSKTIKNENIGILRNDRQRTQKLRIFKKLFETYRNNDAMLTYISESLQK